jgi:hypothetical protein
MTFMTFLYCIQKILNFIIEVIRLITNLLFKPLDPLYIRNTVTWYYRNKIIR